MNRSQQAKEDAWHMIYMADLIIHRAWSLPPPP